MSKIANSLWVEEFRPKTIDEYVGNEEFVSKVKHWISIDDIQNLLLYGPPGCGKTTIGKIIASALDADLLYINASDENGIDLIRDKIKTFVSSIGFSKWKIVLLDEADYLTQHGAQPAMRNILETYSAHSRFIFTCNFPERIIEPLQSRLSAFRIDTGSKKEIALRCNHILDVKQIQFESSDLAIVINKYYPDQRKIINFLQRSSNTGKLILDKTVLFDGSYCSKIVETIKNSGDPKTTFTSIRQIIVDSKVRQFDELFKYLYDNLDEFVPNGKKAQTILHIADCQHKILNVVDGEIQIAAMFINILRDLK